MTRINKILMTVLLSMTIVGCGSEEVFVEATCVGHKGSTEIWKTDDGLMFKHDPDDWSHRRMRTIGQKYTVAISMEKYLKARRQIDLNSYELMAQRSLKNVSKK